MRVWEYTNGGTWVRKGQGYPKLRRPTLDFFFKPKLSSNGQILATSVIGETLRPDYVKIMRLFGNGTWVSLGSELVSKPRARNIDDFGREMDLSGDGLTLAVGNEFEKTRGVSTGAVYVFTAGA